MILKNKKILIGVSGSIAAYKSCELIRTLQKKGCTVRVCMTPSATEFIGKLTFKSLTGFDVFTDWKDGNTGLEHISWARWADGLIIAPATANTISKIALGIADNFLTSVVLAYDKKILFAPAMNTKMYLSPQIQNNIDKLKEYGHQFIEPEKGELACGEEGEGKLADIEDITTAIMRLVFPQILKGKNILITAGGTREHFDPIRYISNSSSGQMGYALARISYALGGNVTLISAPTCLRPIYGIKTINVTSAKDMYKEVMKHLNNTDIIIMNAAVADYRPDQFSKKKLKKTQDKNIITLVPNPDILSQIGKIKKNNQIIIGFAAESDNIIENAINKLKRKNLDYIIANSLEFFNKNIHKGWIIDKNGELIEIPALDKESSALFILEKIFKR